MIQTFLPLWPVFHQLPSTPSRAVWWAGGILSGPDTSVNSSKRSFNDDPGMLQLSISSLASLCHDLWTVMLPPSCTTPSTVNGENCNLFELSIPDFNRNQCYHSLTGCVMFPCGFDFRHQSNGRNICHRYSSSFILLKSRMYDLFRELIYWKIYDYPSILGKRFCSRMEEIVLDFLDTQGTLRYQLKILVKKWIQKDRF